MSKPRLKLIAVIDNEAHADTIISSIRTELQGKDVFEEHNLIRYLNDTGQIELAFDFRFNSRLDRNSIMTWLKDQVKDHQVVKTWVQSVKLTSHLCTHDDAVVLPCNETEYEEVLV